MRERDMVYFDDKKQNDDMSMEDILASIRKYVSEEDIKNNNNNVQEQQQSTKISHPKNTQYPQNNRSNNDDYDDKNNDEDDDDEITISLDESQIIDKNNNQNDVFVENNSQHPVQPENNQEISNIIYNEQSDLESQLKDGANNNMSDQKQQKNGPFDKLADALKSYAQKPDVSYPQKQQYSNPNNMLTIDQFLKDIATPIIEKWIEKNMSKMVDEAINKEIEKLKSL